MNSGVQFFIFIVLLNLACVCIGGNEKVPRDSFCRDFWEQETLTNGVWGLGDKLAGSGLEIGLGVTNIYQQNVHGGISTHRKAGRFSSSYDLEVSTNLQKLLGIEGGGLFAHIEGGWPDTEGIDVVSVGSAFGVNVDATGNNTILVKQFYYEGSIFNDSFTLMIGKIDFTGIFDASAYADDETSQFLNGAFVDDPTIPFPDYSLGVVLSRNLTDSWYIIGGVADAQADRRETGFRTTFHGEDYFFYVLETGVTAQLASAKGLLQGAYRVGLWNDPQPKAHSDSGKYFRDDVGFYLSCDQMLAKENSDPRDNQGLGTFFRCGYASSKKNDITNFWSAGFQYQGLIEGCDDDVLSVGFAHGVFCDKASLTYPEGYESVTELYYNARICPYLSVSPSIQYIANPGGAKDVSDAVAVGVRAQMSF